MKIAILGSTGMLGSTVRKVLASYDLICPSHAFFDVETTTPQSLVSFLSQFDYLINCAGITKPNIDEADPALVFRALKVNSCFPYMLALAAEHANCRVIQIATDCVFSGHGSGYDELSAHDPLDVYGKTKSLGEVPSPNVRHLRCSIIGPEQKSHLSLLDWFLNQPQGATVKGFTNHFWNGLTTLAFARLCHGVIENDLWLDIPQVQHIVPANFVTKEWMLRDFAKAYARSDLTVETAAAPERVDRVLSTVNPKVNSKLWVAAGYETIPTVSQMIDEMAAQ